jgi:hypothetical protein
MIFYELDRASGKKWARCESPFPLEGEYSGIHYRWEYVKRDFDGLAWYGFIWQRFWIDKSGRKHRTWREAKQRNEYLI